MSRPLVAAVVLLVALTTLLSGSGTSSADSPVGKIYYVSDGAILRANLDGSAAEEIVPAGSSPGDLEIDKTAAFVYWINTIDDKIQRADTEGGNIVDIVTGIDRPVRLALDDAGKIYWTTREGGVISDGKVWRADVDGGNLEEVLAFRGVTAVAVDPVGGYIYWGGIDTIFRSLLDGRGKELWRSTPLFIQDIDLDRSAEHVYFVTWLVNPVPCCAQSATVGRRGTNAWAIAQAETRWSYVALDLDHGHVYWVDAPTRELRRANTDGSGSFSPISGCCEGPVALGPCPAGESCPPPPAAPTATPAPTQTPCPAGEKKLPSGCAVGGIAADSNLRSLPLEGSSPGSRNVGVLAVVIAGMAAIALAMGGAASYARRRRVRR